MKNNDYKKDIEKLSLTRKEIDKINEIISLLPLRKTIRDEAIIEGVSDVFSSIEKLININTNLDKLFNVESKNLSYIPSNCIINIKNEKIIQDCVIFFIKEINFLNNNRRKLLKYILKELFKIKKERLSKYLYSGINNDSALYYLSKIRTSQELINKL
jgi:hypothetical protein